MEDLTLIGLILVIIGIVLAPFTCFISLIALTIIGIILIIIGENQKSTYPMPLPPPYYPPPGYPCPACGLPLNYVPQYNRYYCYNCRTYR